MKGIISVITLIIGIIAYVVGTIPAIFIGVIIEKPVLLILILIIGTTLVFYRYNDSKLTSWLATIILCGLSYFFMIQNPGTDDSFSGLGDVVKYTFLGSLFATIALPVIARYLFLVLESFSGNYKAKQNDQQQIPQEKTKMCIHCGEINKLETKYCNKCGMRFTK
ncbi:MAG: zinc ribbon domain-containing protein [Bacilli bacterium]|nr:zinc ribbon domain-containing protein [Bacilli bacterium]